MVFSLASPITNPKDFFRIAVSLIVLPPSAISPRKTGIFFPFSPTSFFKRGLFFSIFFHPGSLLSFSL